MRCDLFHPRACPVYCEDGICAIETDMGEQGDVEDCFHRKRMNRLNRALENDLRGGAGPFVRQWNKEFA